MFFKMSAQKAFLGAIMLLVGALIFFASIGRILGSLIIDERTIFIIGVSLGAVLLLLEVFYLI